MVFLKSVSIAIVLSSAQDEIWSKRGQNDSDYLGFPMSPVGDLNLDGTPDFLIGAPQSDIAGRNTGRVYAYSGATGDELFTLDGARQDFGFGIGLSRWGDVDLDGVEDFLVGQWHDGGVVFGYSGRTQQELVSWSDGDDRFDYFGAQVDMLGDLDGDGIPEVGTTAIWDETNGPNAGRALVYSMASSSPLVDLYGEVEYDELGTSGMRSVGDLDRDGVPEFATGAPRHSANGQIGGGRVYLFDGQSLQLSTVLDGELDLLFLGHGLSSAGDLNLDGHPEFLIGAARGDFEIGEARVICGRTLTTLYRHVGRETLGGSNSFTSPGDLDGDGIDDFALGDPVADSQSSGINHGEITAFRGHALYVQAWPRERTAGEVVELRTAGGAPGSPVVLFVVGVNQAPFTVPIASEVLDGEGVWSVQATIPSGLADTEVELQSYAFNEAGRLVASGVDRLQLK